jgi:hypothetical protein
MQIEKYIVEALFPKVDWNAKVESQDLDVA